MNRFLDHVHLRQNSKLPDLTVMVPAPVPDVALNVMEFGVQPAEARGDGGPIMTVFRGVDVLGRFEDRVRLAVGLLKARVVRIVEVQVQKELARQRFQTRREIVDMRIGSELRKSRSLNRMRPRMRVVRRRWDRMVMMRSVVRVLRRRSRVDRTRVVNVVVRATDDVPVAVANHVVVVIDVTRLIILSGGAAGGDKRGPRDSR